MLGGLYGDEGKGKVVSWLCHNSQNPLVIRFNGGHQAGHTVHYNGKFHISSQFGSGALLKCPTYLMERCTVEPIGLYNEYHVFPDGTRRKLYINRKCPVTTPYDMRANRLIDLEKKHGSCGVGFGQTLQREQDHYSLLFEDLYHPTVLRLKLEQIKKYYNLDLGEETDKNFVEVCEQVIDHNETFIMVDDIDEVEVKCEFNNVIFEGAQGLMLDQNIGFFPHVTRSNTDTTNIREYGPFIDVYVVVRAYQTRHGNGPLTFEDSVNIPDNPYETNFSTSFQGKFRKAPLDLDILQYAISKDPYIKRGIFNLVITCLDVINTYCVVHYNRLKEFETQHDFISYIINTIKPDFTYLSGSPETTAMEKL